MTFLVLRFFDLFFTKKFKINFFIFVQNIKLHWKNVLFWNLFTYQKNTFPEFKSLSLVNILQPQTSPRDLQSREFLLLILRKKEETKSLSIQNTPWTVEFIWMFEFHKQRSASSCRSEKDVLKYNGVWKERQKEKRYIFGNESWEDGYRGGGGTGGRFLKEPLR